MYAGGSYMTLDVTHPMLWGWIRMNEAASGRGKKRRRLLRVINFVGGRLAADVSVVLVRRWPACAR
jgi:hypothetical protein